jgi:hypothetical protein
MAKELKITDDFTIREKLALRVLLLAFRIAKPFEWQHEIDKYVKELEAMLGGKEN